MIIAPLFYLHESIDHQYLFGKSFYSHALLLNSPEQNGDGQSRRDYYHIYTGPFHAATIKQQYKRIWIGGRPGLVKNDFYDLYADPREMCGMMGQFLWAWDPFDMMKKRHDGMNKKYPFTPTCHGVPFEGIENLRPESKVFQETVRKSMQASK